MPIRYLADSEREKFEADRGILYTLCKQFSRLIPEELASSEKSDSVFHSVNTSQGRCRNCDFRFGVEGRTECRRPYTTYCVSLFSRQNEIY